MEHFKKINITTYQKIKVNINYVPNILPNVIIVLPNIYYTIYIDKY